MISLVGSEDNSLLSAILLEDKENVNKMNNLIKILGHLSVFYTYNTNWDNKNLPGYSKIDSKLLDEPIKSRSPTKKALGTIEAHTFHLSMPYTNEVKIVSIIVFKFVIHFVFKEKKNGDFNLDFSFFRRSFGLKTNLIC